MTGTDSGPPGLWGALRSTGLQPLAPQLACHGVRSLTDIASRFNELVAAGFLPGQLQRLCEQPMGSSLDSAAAPRRDFPAVRDGGSRLPTVSPSRGIARPAGRQFEGLV